MATKGFVVIPEAGRKVTLAADLAAMDGCDVVPAENAELLLVVTSADGEAADRALQTKIEGHWAVRALLMTFGALDGEEGDDVSFGVGRAPFG